MDLSELQGLRIQELSELAKSLKISDDISGLNKQELTVKILRSGKIVSFKILACVPLPQPGGPINTITIYFYKFYFYLIIFHIEMKIIVFVSVKRNPLQQ